NSSRGSIRPYRTRKRIVVFEDQLAQIAPDRIDAFKPRLFCRGGFYRCWDVSTRSIVFDVLVKTETAAANIISIGKSAVFFIDAFFVVDLSRRVYFRTKGRQRICEVFDGIHIVRHCWFRGSYVNYRSLFPAADEKNQNGKSDVFPDQRHRGRLDSLIALLRF
ncbi:MAG: hypothetical protein OEQ28_02120, partial [Acidobacteriota bacterium]|nr:hypothetical protein [Acidobacteriota bacterium]